MDTQHSSHDAGGRYRLWILADWFVEVDFSGYYLGRLGEGSFGSVLTLQDDDGSMVAWKLPKLLADTMAENYYIERLVDQEAQVVRKVLNAKPSSLGTRLESDVGISTACLLRARGERRTGAFKGLRELEQAEQEAAEQHGGALFIQFRKDKPPRLCSVQRNGSGGLKVVPEGAKDDLLNVLGTELWRDATNFSSPSFSIPSFYAPESPHKLAVGGEAPRMTPLGHSVELSNLGNVWYTGLASIQWDWAEQSLQQSIAEGRLNCWPVESHCHLWKRILSAVAALHRRGYIHADIRPANIFCTSDGGSPDHYFLGDYGSFSAGDGPVGSGASADSDATVGPDVGRGRVSPFYSVERRSGIQRETADVAIVVKTSSNEYRVWLGWRSFALDSDKGENPRPELIAEIVNYRPASDPPSRLQSDLLLPGDRLRVRDHVFKVKLQPEAATQSALLSAGLLCICEGWYATVLYDKLAIAGTFESDEIGKPRVIPLSGFTELRQWSAATDVFSVGALVLYTIYGASRLRAVIDENGHQTSRGDADGSLTAHVGGGGGNLPSPLSSTPSAVGGSPQVMAAIDSEFREIMGVLEGVPFFRMIWPDLDLLANYVTKSARTAAAERDADAKERLYQELKDALLSRADDLTDSRTETSSKSPLRGSDNLLGVVSNITQSVPNIKVVLRAFQGNAVQFVLFMHFVLRCLHRKDHLHGGATHSEHVEFGSEPFCVSRITSVNEGAADDAYKEFEAFVVALGNENSCRQSVSERWGNTGLRHTGRSCCPKRQP